MLDAYGTPPRGPACDTRDTHRREEYGRRSQIRLGRARRLSWPEQLLERGGARRGSQREKHLGLQAIRRVRRDGGVSNVDIDGNNALQTKAIGVTISTFETLPKCFLRRTPSG